MTLSWDLNLSVVCCWCNKKPFFPRARIRITMRRWFDCVNNCFFCWIYIRFKSKYQPKLRIRLCPGKSHLRVISHWSRLYKESFVLQESRANVMEKTPDVKDDGMSQADLLSKQASELFTVDTSLQVIALWIKPVHNSAMTTEFRVDQLKMLQFMMVQFWLQGHW